MSDYDPNSEWTPPSPPLPEGELPDEPQFADELSETRPNQPVLLAETLAADWRTQRALAREQEFAARISELTAQIEHYPHTPVNFIIRGEVYLAHGQAEAAIVDFQRALDLAESRVDRLPWGYVNAGLIDRAREGLNEAQDRLHAARA